MTAVLAAEDVGLPGLPAYPTGWLAQLASPFKGKLWSHGSPTGVAR